MQALAATTAVVFTTACSKPSDQDLVSSAQTFLAQEDRKSAIVQLKSALQLNPNSAQARFLLGTALLGEGDAVAAVVELEKASELKFDDNLVMPVLAQSLLATGQAKKLTDLYARTRLEDAGAHAALKASVAEAFVAQGALERAEAAASQALELDPKNAAAKLLLARFTAGRGDFDKALASIDSIIADYPKHILAWHLKGELLWAGKRDVPGAVEAFKQTLVLEPRFIPGHASLMMHALQQKDMAAFRTQLGKLKAAMPSSPETLFFEARLALVDGQSERARDLIQQLLRGAPESPRVLELAGAVELNGGSLTLAESHLNKALQLQPELATARRQLAQVYVRSGQAERALSTLRPLLAGNAAAQELALAAEAHMQLGNLAESQALFERAAKANPGDTKVRTALAIARMSKGDPAEGLADLEAISRTDTTAYADLALISSQLRLKNVEAALGAIDRLQAKLPQAAVPHHLRGTVLAQQKKLDAARASFDKALAVDPKYFPAVSSLAALDIAENKTDQALKRFQDALVREPKNYRALLAVAELKMQAGAPAEEIRTLLTDSIRANPGEASPRLMLIDFLLSRREHGPARAAAQDALAALPASLPLMDALGRTQLAAGELQQAVSSFTKLAADQPQSVQAQLRLAQAHGVSKDYPAAKRALRRALEIDPKSAPAYSALVEIALVEKRFDEAIQIAQEVQKQSGKSAFGHILEADVHASRRDWPRAVTAQQAALTLDRSNPTAIRLHSLLTLAGRSSEAERLAAAWLLERPADAQFIFHLGTIAMEGGRYAEAETLYRRVLALRPEDATAMNNVAWVMTRQGKPGAVPFAESALRLMPEQPALMDTLASALAGEGKLPQAIDWQRKALAKAGDNASYRLRLAKLLIQSGDKSGARAELKTLASLGDKFADQAEVQQLLKTL